MTRNDPLHQRVKKEENGGWAGGGEGGGGQEGKHHTELPVAASQHLQRKPTRYW